MISPYERELKEVMWVYDPEQYNRRVQCGNCKAAKAVGTWPQMWANCDSGHGSVELIRLLRPTHPLTIKPESKCSDFISMSDDGEPVMVVIPAHEWAALTGRKGKGEK